MSSYDKQQYDKLQTPFWRLMGQKAKPHEIERERRMKWANKTYGDLALERSARGEVRRGVDQLRQLQGGIHASI